PTAIYTLSLHDALPISALALAGIDANTPDAEGGVIGRVEGTKEPNGYLEEGSLIAAQGKIASGMEMDHFKLALLGQDIYLENGIDRKSTRLNSSHVSIS